MLLVCLTLFLTTLATLASGLVLTVTEGCRVLISTTAGIDFKSTSSATQLSPTEPLASTSSTSITTSTAIFTTPPASTSAPSLEQPRSCGGVLYDFGSMSSINPFVADVCPQDIAITNGILEITLKPGCYPTVSYPTRLNFGKFDVVMRAAGGSGVVTAFSLYGDNKDEVDIELVGKTPNNFQSMYFPQGQIRGQKEQYHESSPTSDMFATFHTYTIEHTQAAFNWYLDGKLVRSLPSNDPNFPATANHLKLGLWDGSDTSGWAGTVDYSSGPKVMSVKSIRFEPYC